MLWKSEKTVPNNRCLNWTHFPNGVTQRARTVRQLFTYLGLEELTSSELSTNTYLENFYMSLHDTYKRTQVLKPQFKAHPFTTWCDSQCYPPIHVLSGTCTPQFNPRMREISILLKTVYILLIASKHKHHKNYDLIGYYTSLQMQTSHILVTIYISSLEDFT